MRLETLLAQAGLGADPRTGAVSTPICQSATFRHPRLGESTGFDYSRTANPTRSELERVLAKLDGGAGASAFSSGMAALDAVFRLAIEDGRGRILVTEDPYGGTVRLLDKFCRPAGLIPVYIDTSDTEAAERELSSGTYALALVETPSNPLMRVADVDAIAEAARRAGTLLAVDNTFLTPLLFRPFEHGADLAVYSATKYLGGHNDLVAGAVASRTAELAAKVAFVLNSAGAILGPMDSWLLIRGLKTLSVRMERQQANAMKVAEYLAGHPRVTKVYFPGLETDPWHDRLKRQASGFGAMLSFEVADPALAAGILAEVKVFSFAESLGGVESLVTFPKVQTHAAVDPALCARLGINDRLLRLSIGIEDARDLIADLENALR